jgi:hypothetical protein
LNAIKIQYLGETPVDVSSHPMYSKFTPSDWALWFIESYGQIDGGHHKAWVLDQVSRIMLGTPVLVSEATWSNGHCEDRVNLGDPSEQYLAWREKMLDRDENGEPQYDYDEGIAP